MGKIIHHIHEPKIPPKIQIQTDNTETERNKHLLEITHKSCTKNCVTQKTRFTTHLVLPDYRILLYLTHGVEM